MREPAAAPQRSSRARRAVALTARRAPLTPYARPVEPAPVARYASGRYRAAIAAGALCAGGLLVWGAAGGATAVAAAGAVGLLFVALFARATWDKASRGGCALARQGDLLVGGELARPLPVAGTTFEIASDHDGGWVIVLRHPSQTVRLGAGGWTTDRERFVTRAGAERLLLDLGLTPQR